MGHKAKGEVSTPRYHVTDSPPSSCPHFLTHVLYIHMYFPLLPSDFTKPLPPMSPSLPPPLTYDDDQADELGVRPLPTLAGDDVPLLRSAHYDLSGCNLLLV